MVNYAKLKDMVSSCIRGWNIVPKHVKSLIPEIDLKFLNNFLLIKICVLNNYCTIMKEISKLIKLER